MINRTILLTVIVFTFVLVSTAQVKQISSREFYEANSNAYKLMSERSRRTVVKTDILNNGTILSSSTKIEERILPDKMRFVSIEKKGSDETSTELIRIGTMEYRRENNGQWTAKDISGSGGGSGSGTGVSSCSQYTEESSFVEGIPASKLRNFTITQTSKGLSFDDFVIWFDHQGLFIRSERLKGLLDPRIEETRSVATYEYEPKDLKIEAPIINIKSQ